MFYVHILGRSVCPPLLVVRLVLLNLLDIFVSLKSGVVFKVFKCSRSKLPEHLERLNYFLR